jgi:hypothetical protein
MKISAYLSLFLIMLTLSACNGTTVGLGAAYLGIEGTKPDELPPADTEDQIAEHESWCYETMGYPECYAHPQSVDPNRLINVDPANRYPLTPHAYRETVQEDRQQ